MTEQKPELWFSETWEQLQDIAYTLLRNGHIRNLRYRFDPSTGLYRIRFFETEQGIPKLYWLNIEPDPPDPEEERNADQLEWHEWSWS